MGHLSEMTEIEGILKKFRRINKTGFYIPKLRISVDSCRSKKNYNLQLILKAKYFSLHTPNKS